MAHLVLLPLTAGTVALMATGLAVLVAAVVIVVRLFGGPKEKP